MIRYHHNIHKTLEREVLRALQSRGIETRTVKRFQYNDEVVRWADMVFTTGRIIGKTEESLARLFLLIILVWYRNLCVGTRVSDPVNFFAVSGSGSCKSEFIKLDPDPACTHLD